MNSRSVDGKPIGVLGLQGDFDAHRRAFEEAGVPVCIVRFPEQLDDISGLTLPGGESTTLVKLMKEMGFVDAIRRFAAGGRPIYGTCAGAILMAARVSNPVQFSLGLMDIDIERNAYGRQRESFETGQGHVMGELARRPAASARPELLDLVLIRAPRITRCGPGVDLLVTHQPAAGKAEPVLVRQGNLLAGTFHPEMGSDRRIHRYFGEMALQMAPLV